MIDKVEAVNNTSFSQPLNHYTLVVKLHMHLHKPINYKVHRITDIIGPEELFANLLLDILHPKSKHAECFITGMLHIVDVSEAGSEEHLNVVIISVLDAMKQ